MRSYASGYAGQRPGRDVQYFTHKQGAEALAAVNAVPEGEPVNIVGHSYGASTAADVAGAAERPVNNLVGVDPVSKPGNDNPSSLPNVESVTHVNGEGKGGLDNMIEGAGKLLGGGKPDAFKNPDNTINADARHADFSTMMSTAGADGRSVENILDDSYKN